MDTGGIDNGRLYSFVRRIEHVQEEIDAGNEDKTEIFKEAKSDGFDTNIMKAVIKRRRNGKGATKEGDALLEIYERAIEQAEGSTTAQPSRTRRSTREDGEDESPTAH